MSKYSIGEQKDLMVRAASIRDMDDKNLVVDIVVNDFSQRDSHGTTFDPKAFDNSIRVRGPKAGDAFRLRHLKHHDQRQDPIGKPLEIPFDNQVLRVIGGITPSERGRNHYEDIKFGLFEYSIGFYTIATDPKDDAHITDLDWWEYSSVTFGSNPGTKTLAVRHSILNQHTNEQALTMHETALQKGNYTDTRFIELEAQVKELRSQLDALRQAKPADKPADKPTINASTLKQLFKSN